MPRSILRGSPTSRLIASSSWTAGVQRESPFKGRVARKYGVHRETCSGLSRVGCAYDAPSGRFRRGDRPWLVRAPVAHAGAKGRQLLAAVSACVPPRRRHALLVQTEGATQRHRGLRILRWLHDPSRLVGVGHVRRPIACASTTRRSPPTSSDGASATSCSSWFPPKVGRAVGRAPRRVGRVSKKPEVTERRRPYFPAYSS